VERAGVLRRVKEGKLKLVSAAQLLGISPRQAKRLWKRYQEQGIQGLQHRAAGRRSNRAKPEKFRKQVLALVRDKYSGGMEERFGPTLAAEHLASEDGLEITSGTLRRWMLSADYGAESVSADPIASGASARHISASWCSWMEVSMAGWRNVVPKAV
jgi:transposase